MSGNGDGRNGDGLTQLGAKDFKTENAAVRQSRDAAPFESGGGGKVRYSRKDERRGEPVRYIREFSSIQAASRVRWTEALIVLQGTPKEAVERLMSAS